MTRDIGRPPSPWQRAVAVVTEPRASRPPQHECRSARRRHCWIAHPPASLRLALESLASQTRTSCAAPSSLSQFKSRSECRVRPGLPWSLTDSESLAIRSSGLQWLPFRRTRTRSPSGTSSVADRRSGQTEWPRSDGLGPVRPASPNRRRVTESPAVTSPQARRQCGRTPGQSASRSDYLARRQRVPVGRTGPAPGSWADWHCSHGPGLPEPRVTVPVSVLVTNRHSESAGVSAGKSPARSRCSVGSGPGPPAFLHSEPDYPRVWRLPTRSVTVTEARTTPLHNRDPDQRLQVLINLSESVLPSSPR